MQLACLEKNKLWEWGKGKEDGKLRSLLDTAEGVLTASDQGVGLQELMLQVSKAKNPAGLVKLTNQKEAKLIASMSTLMATNKESQAKNLKQNTERLDCVYAAQVGDYQSDQSPAKKTKTGADLVD